MKPILELDTNRLSERLAEMGEPQYRSQEILRWILQHRVTSFAAMTSLPRDLRQRLQELFEIRTSRVLRLSKSEGGTTKFVLAWHDGATTETVMIPAPRAGIRRTACLSTQVGCDVGCRFCASGIGGSLRNLSVGEVLEQAVIVADHLGSQQERLSHIVFMGMGEPLANYEVTVESIRRIIVPWGLNIGQRRITVSTVGLPKQIERLAKEDLQVTLALSLHAPNDGLRRELIPWADGIPLARLLESCRTYLSRTGRQVTLEYCLLAGVNDLDEHALQLASIAQDIRAHINLMMYNPVKGLPYDRPSRSRALQFLRTIRKQGVAVQLRESRGLDNDAACGQLRRELASLSS